jgi:2-polyprenyl-6-methoxyphenol hydroxylase-like FAD-dependent oxidoreductase
MHLFAAAVGGGRVYWAAKLDALPGEWPGRTPSEARAELLGQLAGWDPRIIDAVREPGPLVITDVVDRDPVPRWSFGRVTLVGDAAHPMSPAVGQGASLAVEDAVVLADCLRRHADVPAALAAYSEARVPRAAAVVGRSRRSRTVITGVSDLYAWRWEEDRDAHSVVN